MRPPEISEARLQRRAMAYLRQSTETQVRENVGSTALQREVRELLEEWGYPPERIEVIESDLGVSGSLPGSRSGFAHLLEQMATGTVGLVAVTESSRLARNLTDFAAFAQLAETHDVFLVAGRQITNFRDANAAFIGTMLGANAARENQARVQLGKQARRKKAEAGIAVTAPPVGYVVMAKKNWIKDPDPQVRDIIQLIFDKFLEVRSTGAVIRVFRRQGIVIPGRISKHGRAWTPVARRTDVYRILIHPAYAGFYTYGLTEREPRIAGRAVRRHRVGRTQGRWVQTPNHHELYIEPALWEQIQEQLASNRRKLRAAPGRGEALVQGVLRCTQHGRMFRTWYSARDHRGRERVKRSPYYHCLGGSPDMRPICSRVRAHRIDKLVEFEVLQALRPPSLDAIAQAGREAMREHQLRVRGREDARRRAQHAVEDAERAFDQAVGQPYVQKRMGERLEVALRELEVLRVAQESQPLHPPLTLGQKEAAELRTLLDDLPALWRHPSITDDQRKAVIRAVIDTVYATPSRDRWLIEINWVGGGRTSGDFLTVHGVQSELERLKATGLPAAEIAQELARQGIVQMSGRAAGKPYTEKKVRESMWYISRKLAGRTASSRQKEGGSF